MDNKALTKAQLKTTLAAQTGLTVKQVEQFLEKFSETAISEINRVGVFTIPDLAKITKKVKPATEEKEGRNPFTGQPMVVKAKPERSVVKLAALKKLKDSV